jgi:hypothetical protein
MNDRRAMLCEGRMEHMKDGAYEGTVRTEGGKDGRIEKREGRSI